MADKLLLVLQLLASSIPYIMMIANVDPVITVIVNVLVLIINKLIDEMNQGA